MLLMCQSKFCSGTESRNGLTHILNIAVLNWFRQPQLASPGTENVTSPLKESEIGVVLVGM